MGVKPRQDLGQGRRLWPVSRPRSRRNPPWSGQDAGSM